MTGKKLTKKAVKEKLKTYGVAGYSSAKICLYLRYVFCGDYYGQIDDHNVLNLKTFGITDLVIKNYKIQL